MRRWLFFLAHTFAVLALACLLLRAHQHQDFASRLRGSAAEWQSRSAPR